MDPDRKTTNAVKSQELSSMADRDTMAQLLWKKSESFRTQDSRAITFWGFHKLKTCHHGEPHMDFFFFVAFILIANTL